MWQVGSISAAQKSVLAYRGSHTEEDSPFHPAVAVSLRAGRDRRCALPHTHQKPLRDSSLAAAAAGRAGLRPLAGSARRAAARTADWLGRGGAGAGRGPRRRGLGRGRLLPPRIAGGFRELTSLFLFIPVQVVLAAESI